MRQKLSLLTKTMLLLGALVAGGGSAWAGSKTYQHVFAAGQTYSAGERTFSTINWTVSGTNIGSYNSANYAGIQIGSSSKNGKYTLTSKKAWGTQTDTDYEGYINVTEVRLWLNLGGTSVTPSVTIGDKAATSDGTAVVKNSNTGGDYTKATKVTFTPASDGKTGVVVIDITSVKAGYVCAIEIDCEEDSADPTKADPELSWTAASKDVTYNTTGEYTGIPTLNNTHGLTVEYSSSNTSVAEINASTGALTIKNVTGSTTIKANFEGDDTYNAGYATYTLNVTHVAIIEDGVFNFGEGIDYGSGVTYGSSNNIGTDASTWTAVNVTLQVAGRNIWNEGDGTLRLYKTSSDPCGQITLNCPTGYVITKIEFTMGSKSSLTTTQGSYSSGTWTGAAQSVTFTSPSDATHIKTISVTYTNELTKTVESYGWATYVAPAAVSFAAGDAYVVTDVDEIEGTITIVGVTAVPANTPLLLKGEGVKTVSVLETTPDAPTTNLLAICTGTAPATGYYYVLAKDGDGAGFKQWTGDASTLKDRVVLVLSQPQPGGSEARMLRFVESDTQGISAALMNKETMNDVVYDLQGRSVARPTKGLYIVNGKKVIMK